MLSEAARRSTGLGLGLGLRHGRRLSRGGQRDAGDRRGADGDRRRQRAGRLLRDLQRHAERPPAAGRDRALTPARPRTQLASRRSSRRVRRRRLSRKAQLGSLSPGSSMRGSCAYAGPGIRRAGWRSPVPSDSTVGVSWSRASVSRVALPPGSGKRALRPLELTFGGHPSRASAGGTPSAASRRERSWRRCPQAGRGASVVSCSAVLRSASSA
jgi:hypothetical protein